MRSSIFVCLLILAGGCTKFSLLNALVPARNYDRKVDVSFGELDRQKLDVYRPRNAKSDLPVVIFFYGGEWHAGQRGDYQFVGQALTSRGFIAVLPDYRLYPQATFPAFVQDGAAAVRWVHDHIADYGGDPDRVYLMGHSAGGHIAALLTLDEHYLREVGLNRGAIRATATLAAPLNFKPFPEDRAVFNQAPNDDTPDPAIEPIDFVDGHAPPMQLIQGSKDTTVEPYNATTLADRIKSRGGEVQIVMYPKRGHLGVMLALAYPLRFLAPVLDDATDFFRTH